MLECMLGALLPPARPALIIIIVKVVLKRVKKNKRAKSEPWTNGTQAVI